MSPSPWAQASRPDNTSPLMICLLFLTLFFHFEDPTSHNDGVSACDPEVAVCSTLWPGYLLSPGDLPGCIGPPLFGLYPNRLYPNGLFMIGLSPFGLPMTFGLSPFGLFWTTGTFRLQGHLDYRHLDYRRLDYFGLQGRSDYKDIWTTAVWTTKTNRLKVFRQL